MKPDSPLFPDSPKVSLAGSAVIALSIVRGQAVDSECQSRASEILLAVRNPASNPTHPNIISVPTLRVPKALMASLVDTLELIATWPDGVTFYRFPEIRSDRDNGHHPIVFTIESLFSRKLGVADFLESGKMVYSSCLFSVTPGTTEYKTKNPYGSSETIAMGNIWVTVREGFDLFPKGNASYSQIFPASLDALEEVKATGDLSRFPHPLNPAIHSIGGLCIASSINTIRYLFPKAT